MLPSVSVAMATYNGETYLCEQIDSIFAQTVSIQELVISDDASTDSTWKIILEYAAKDPRIKAIRNETNIGFKENFEKSIRLCTGDYIALCDQDDIWEPNHLETLSNCIGENLLVCGNSKFIDSHGNEQHRTLCDVKRFDAELSNDDILRFISIYQNPFQGASMMIRRDFLNIALPIPNSVKYHDVWLAHIATAMNSFVYTKEIVTKYRVHGRNASGIHEKKSVFRPLLRHVLKGHTSTNRKEVIEELSKLKCEQYFTNRSVIEEVERYFDRENSFIGRVMNFFYEIYNFNILYGK